MWERDLKSSHYRVAWLMAAGFLIMLGNGCKKAETPEGPAAASADTAFSLIDPGIDDIPGRDTARTREYLKGLHRHWRVAMESVTIHCDSGDCDGNESVHIRVYTHRRTFKIDPTRILPQNAQNVRGHIVLKFVNLDAFEYKHLGLGPRDSAYLWVGKTDTLTQSGRGHRERAMAVFRIAEDGQATGVRRVYEALRCNLGRDPDSSAAHLRDKGTCEGGVDPEVLYDEPVPENIRHLVRPLRIRKSGSRDIFHDQGLWFSCTGGCCQSTTFGPY